MKNTPFEKVPLTEDERDLLMTVYHTRRRFLLTVYAILIAIGFATSFRGLDFRVRGSDMECGLTGDQKRNIAAKVNGLLKSFKSAASIIKVKEKLATLGKPITKAAVCLETGFCYKTIHRNWDKDLTEILNEINTYNKTVNSGVLDTQILDEINNEYYCLETGEAA